VPALNQRQREIAQVLRGGDNVRVKGLIQEENFQNVAILFGRQLFSAFLAEPFFITGPGNRPAIF
jgi:hypothetical protein